MGQIVKDLSRICQIPPTAETRELWHKKPGIFAENFRGKAIISPVILVVAGILPFINIIGAWLSVGPILLGCSYDGCIPCSLSPLFFQIMFGLAVIPLGYNTLKGKSVSHSSENSFIALILGLSALILVVGNEFVVATEYLTPFSEWLPNPFYLMMWLNAILILGGAVIGLVFGNKN